MRRALTWLSLAVVVVGLASIELVSRPDRLVRVAQSWAQGPTKVVDRGCTNYTLNGTFGFTFNGAAVSSGLTGKPGAVVGLMTFDGVGHLTAVVTANANGTVLRRETQGTYTVNRDCTGSIITAALPVPLLTFQADGVIVRDGTEILFVGTIPELVFSGVAKKL